MKLLQRFTSLLGAFNRKLIELILAITTPRTGKRLIFVVSLFASLRSTTSIETLQVLNARLKVADNEQALGFPAAVSNRIWGRNTLSCVAGECLGPRNCTTLCQEELSRMSIRVLSLMPKWMQYAPLEKMLEDALCVLQVNQELQSR